MTNFKEFVNESSLSRIFQKSKDYDVGMLTAFRSGNKDNMKNLRELKALLLKDGFSVTEISGHYVEDYGTDKAKDVKEISLFVADHKETGDLKQALIKYGKKYDQDSVFYKPKDKDGMLIGTNNASFPGLGKEVPLGGSFSAKASEFYSRVKGRPFVFEQSSKTKSLTDYYPTEIKSIKLGESVVLDLE